MAETMTNHTKTAGEKTKMKKQKWAIVPVKKVAEGTRLVTDGGFTCMGDHQTRIVKKDERGELYVSCGQGHHGLDGQLDTAGKNYVGFWLEGTAPGSTPL